MRLLQGLLVIILLAVASPVHAAWKSLQEYLDYIQNNPQPPPVIVTYQDYLDAFPHGDNWFYDSDDIVNVVRQIVVDVASTYSQLSPGDPDRLCIPPSAPRPDDWQARFWVAYINANIRQDTEAGHPPAPADRFRDLILSFLKRGMYLCPDSHGPRGPSRRSH